MPDTTQQPAESPAPRPQQRASLAGRVIEGLIALLLLAALGGYASSVFEKLRERAQRTVCPNHLKAIGLALHEYHGRYNALPPAYTVDANGKRLHSWRTLLLPFLDQGPLYQTIDLSKPWNDPINAEAYATSVPQYQCPSNKTAANATSYLAIVTPQSAIQAPASKTFAEITDGPGNTLLLIEAPADRSVPWMSPQDADEALLLRINSDTRLVHSAGLQALFGDGSVRRLSVTLPADLRRALITTSGNEPIGDY